jgi:hypothetical protein
VGAWLARLRERPFRYAHVAWGTFVLLVCVLLVAGSFQGGHPPPIAFVPHALAAGVAGHLLLLAVGWLAGRGRARLEAGAGPWPFELTLVAIAVGIAGFVSTVFAVDSLGALRTRPGEWLIVAAIAGAHVAAFVLLLLRHSAARWLLAAIAVGWAVGLGREINTARGPGELVLGIGVIVALVVLAAYLSRAARVQKALR